MKKLLLVLICIQGLSLFAQKSIDKLLEQHNKNLVPYISVQELAMPKNKALILDAREIEEYNTSHIKHAIWVGYNNFKIDSVLKNIPDKNQNIAVYCSIGIRSEHIAHKLKKAGYSSVFNLYGGIFEWKNNDFSIVDSENNETEKVHVFSKEWSKWLIKGEKIY